MESTAKKTNPKKLNLIILISLIAVIIIGAASGSVFGYQKKYANTLLPGISIASIDVSGLTPMEALTLLEKPANQIYSEGLRFQYDKKKTTIETTTVAIEDIDASYTILAYDLTASVQNAFLVGRGESFAKNISDWIHAGIFNINMPIEYSLDRDKLAQSLEEEFHSLEKHAVNASLALDKKNNFIATQEKQGTIFDYAKAIDALESDLRQLQNKAITLEIKTENPKITEKNVEPAKKFANTIIARAPFVFQGEGKTFTLDKAALAAMLDFLALKDDNRELPSDFVTIGLKQSSAVKFLQSIAKEIDIPASNGKFEIQSDGKIIALEDAKSGQKVDIEKTISIMHEKIIESPSHEISLAIVKSDPEITSKNINSIQITEKLGEGKSSYANSPTNRRHNISLGAKTLHGILIKPGEEFSLLQALGKIDKSAGYREELVIKENKTKPEVGGGLCQIGTTTFRAALASGLPITMRANHSYTVSYYFPIGTDATIYDPAPDLKFMNDTGNYILFQTKNIGSELMFEFWGKKDGRKIDQTYPVTYNWVNPPPRKTVDTDELKPGETKCTEKAHKGVEAKFDYTVAYPDGTEKKQTFHSKYKPWQEVCLVGKSKDAAKSTTPSNSNANKSSSNTNASKNTNAPKSTNQSTNTSTNANE